MEETITSFVCTKRLALDGSSAPIEVVHPVISPELPMLLNSIYLYSLSFEGVKFLSFTKQLFRVKSATLAKTFIAQGRQTSSPTVVRTSAAAAAASSREHPGKVCMPMAVRIARAAAGD